MGTSLTLLQKEWLVLSLEIDRDIKLELSTGFTGKVNAITGTVITVTVKELGSIIKQLEGVYEKLLIHKRCGNCEMIYPYDEEECPNCNSVKLTTEV